MADHALSQQATDILKSGQLLKTTEELTLQDSNNYDFARRIAQEVSLIFAGQAIKFLDIGHPVRAYSHLGILAPAGIGKDFAWDIIQDSGIFPTDQIKVGRVDNVTEAALSGTIVDSTIVPPPTVTHDVIAVMEASTLLSGSNAASLTASLRAMLEKGQYTRRLAKIAKLPEIIAKGDEKDKKYIESQIAKWGEKGMVVDVDQCAIEVKTTSSWIISSATFGTQIANKSLLSLGDINRLRWRTFLPNMEERIKITTEIGSLPPVTVNPEKRAACKEAWSATISNLKQVCRDGLVISRDDQSYYDRKNIWTETLNEIKEEYTEFKSADYFNEIVSLRYRTEFIRLMYQHAAFKQFARASGYDFAFPTKFILDNKEDGAFAKELWIKEYVPGIIEIVNDINRGQAKSGSQRVTKTAIGKSIVIERLKDGPAKRDELVKLCDAKSISPYLLDNKILPELLGAESIVQINHGWYALKDSELQKEDADKEPENNKQHKPKAVHNEYVRLIGEDPNDE
jgi:hypothetical protein